MIKGDSKTEKVQVSKKNNGPKQNIIRLEFSRITVKNGTTKIIIMILLNGGSQYQENSMILSRNSTRKIAHDSKIPGLALCS